MTQKRIVVCSDGTWNDPEDEIPTNVLRIARAIKPEDANGIQQVVFYDWGVGSYYAQARGGVSGLGMMKNIQDGYRFIVQNYDPGDEIFLFGYSRGAYTARALAGMLNKCGILKRSKADLIPDAFDFYKKKSVKPSSTAGQAWRQKHTVGGQGRGPVVPRRSPVSRVSPSTRGPALGQRPQGHRRRAAATSSQSPPNPGTPSSLPRTRSSELRGCP